MINITSNCKKRFKTKNKLCTDNIDINVNVPYPVVEEISTDSAMTALLTSANVGKAYKFTGTTGTYTNGDIYVVEQGGTSVAFTLTWEDDASATTCYIKVNGTASSSDYDYTLAATASYTPVSTTINILSTDTVNILCGHRSDGGATVTNCTVSPVGTDTSFTFSDFTSSTATASMCYID